MNDRKRELNHNVLSDWLEHQFAGASKLFKPLLVIAGILVVGLVVATIIRGQQERAAGEGWAALLSAGGDSAALLDVAKKHPSTPIARWATASRATAELREASSRIYTDRQQAAESINDAIESFEKVLKETPAGRGNELARTQALLGLAQAHELNFDIDKAKEYYEQLLTAAAGQPLAKYAEQRVELLNQDETRQFYTWYAKAEHQLPGSHIPSSDIPSVSDVPNLPTRLDSLPDFPSLSFPKPTPLPAEEPKPEDKPAEEPKPEDKPAEEPKPEDKPAEEPKPEDKPADAPKPEDKPAEEPKPEDKPAEEPKPEDKPAEEPKPEDKPDDASKPEDKPAEEPKPEDKPDDASKPEDKPADAPKPEDKPADAPKPEDKPADAPKPEDKPADAPKPEDKPAEEPKPS